MHSIVKDLYDICMNNMNINLIRVDNDRVDCKILFEEGEILNE